MPSATGWTSTPFLEVPLRIFAILALRRPFVRVVRLVIPMRGLRALVDGIGLGGGLLMFRNGGFRLVMRLVMLDSVVVGLRGGCEREYLSGSDYLARRQHFPAVIDGIWDWRVRIRWRSPGLGHWKSMDIHLHTEIKYVI